MHRTTTKRSKKPHFQYRINPISRQKSTPAFWRGFIFGLSSPALLFMPINVNHLISLRPPEDDWRAIGNDFRKVLKTRLSAEQTK